MVSVSTQYKYTVEEYNEMQRKAAAERQQRAEERRLQREQPYLPPSPTTVPSMGPPPTMYGYPPTPPQRIPGYPGYTGSNGSMIPIGVPNVQVGYPPGGVPQGYTNMGASMSYPPGGAPQGYTNMGAPTSYPPGGVPQGYTNMGAPMSYPPVGAPMSYPNMVPQVGSTSYPPQPWVAPVIPAVPMVGGNTFVFSMVPHDNFREFWIVVALTRSIADAQMIHGKFMNYCMGYNYILDPMTCMSVIQKTLLKPNVTSPVIQKTDVQKNGMIVFSLGVVQNQWATCILSGPTFGKDGTANLQVFRSWMQPTVFVKWSHVMALLNALHHKNGQTAAQMAHYIFGPTVRPELVQHMMVYPHTISLFAIGFFNTSTLELAKHHLLPLITDIVTNFTPSEVATSSSSSLNPTTSGDTSSSSSSSSTTPTRKSVTTTVIRNATST